MPINYASLRNLTARQIISALIRDGFEFDWQRGSHQLYYHPADRRRVTVSFHSSGETFKPKTLKTMIEQQAHWTQEDLKRLGLLR
jgi:predicted RNA binding protein YcfA (HicA-like mRNA interferase family)